MLRAHKSVRFELPATFKTLAAASKLHRKGSHILRYRHPASLQRISFISTFAKQTHPETSSRIPTSPLLTETAHGKKFEYYLVPSEPAHNQGHEAASGRNSTALNATYPKSQLCSRLADGNVSARNASQPLAWIRRWLSDMFLPVGYPLSVHGCYRPVHTWLFLENLAGSAISVLTAQAMLTAVGVASTAGYSTALAVAIDWTLKDGFGEIGKMFIIKYFAHEFDTHPKHWKLIGEFCSITGALMQLMTCIADPAFFLVFASLGAGLRSIHFSIWGATHMTFTRNMASYNGANVGDIVAKGDSQASLAHILGMGMGVALLSISYTPPFLFGCFALLAAAQVSLTCWLLRAARFEVLDSTRLALLPREFIRTGHVPSLSQISKFENWLNEGLKIGNVLPKINIGSSVAVAFAHCPLDHSISVTQHEKYLIGYKLNGSSAFSRDPKTSDRSSAKIYIVLREEMSVSDVIKASLHATRFDHELHLIEKMSGGQIQLDQAQTCLESSYMWTNTVFETYMRELEANRWKTDLIVWGDSGIRIELNQNKKDQ